MKTAKFFDYAVYFKEPNAPDFGIGIRPVVLGYEACKPNKEKIGPLVRARHILHVVLRGRGFYTIDGTTYTVHGGELFYIPPEKTVSYRPDPDMPWRYLWIELTGEACKNCIARTPMSESPVLRLENFDEIADEIISMFDDCEQGAALSLTARTFRLFALLEEGTRRSVRPLPLPWLAETLAFIERNYCDGTLNVETLAGRIGFSVPYFSRKFKEETGTAPAKYIIDVRIRKACSMLESGTFTVAEVAEAVGYNSPFYFSNEFKNRTGVSPTQYKKSNGK